MCQNLHFSESCIKAHYVPNSVATGKQETVKEVGRSGDGLRMVSRVSVGGDGLRMVSSEWLAGLVSIGFAYTWTGGAGRSIWGWVVQG